MKCNAAAVALTVVASLASKVHGISIPSNEQNIDAPDMEVLGCSEFEGLKMEQSLETEIKNSCDERAGSPGEFAGVFKPGESKSACINFRSGQSLYMSVTNKNKVCEFIGAS